jgi:hypothetical protein
METIILWLFVSVMLILCFIFFWRNNKVLEKRVTKYYKNGDVKFVGYIFDGKKNGNWEYYCNIEEVNLDLKNYPFLYDNQALITEPIIHATGDYHDDKKIGEWVYYLFNGVIDKKVIYSNGLEHGDFISYHFTGEVESKGKYRYGKKIGEWIYNYVDGTLRTTVKYD